MHDLIETLSSFIRASHSVAANVQAAEPLDHPCLIAAPPALIDDLPLPAFSLASDGAISLVAGR
jgi:hypothetical protein